MVPSRSMMPCRMRSVSSPAVNPMSWVKAGMELENATSRT